MDERAVLEKVIKEIILEMRTGTAPAQKGEHGIFQEVEDALAAAKQAQKEYQAKTLEDRKSLIAAIREGILPYVDELAEKTVQETGMGRVEDKKIKIRLALNKTPGVEDLNTGVLTGDDGMSLYEPAPYGVIGAITPSTNPIPTLINNGIGMLAAGNAIYFSVHPGALNVSLFVVEKLNEIIEKTIGIKNLVTTISKPSNEKVEKMMKHPDVSILVVTGGPGIVRQAMSSGKKTIGAGAGNPPVVVDETADIRRAAKSIVWAASFDNGILCTAEKSVIAVEVIEKELVSYMQEEGAWLLKTKEDIQKLLDLTLDENGRPHKDYIGKDAEVILKAAKIPYTGHPKLISLRASKDHPFVIKEMLMPILPITKAHDFQEAFDLALYIEQDLHHTAAIHSNHIERINKLARAIQTSIFVVNGPSFAGLGVTGEGPTTFTIATPTGEGPTTARHFTRRRKLTITDGFSLK